MPTRLPNRWESHLAASGSGLPITRGKTSSFTLAIRLTPSRRSVVVGLTRRSHSSAHMKPIIEAATVDLDRWIDFH